MKEKLFSLGTMAVALTACGQQSAAPQPADQAASANPSTPQSNASPPAAGPSNEPKPATSLPEPQGPIDPKSVEAAGQVVQSYGALIEQKRWPEANKLWGDAGQAAKFQSQLVNYSEVHLEIGNLGEPEGAAGSIFVTMPVIFYGDQADGQPFRRSAEVILRRVNDVPGSSAAQRRWHIERIDLSS